MPGSDTKFPRRVALGDPTFNPSTFCDNEIRTAKYTWATFLPKFLFLEFSKLANFYFLVVCCLQMIPAITNTNGVPSLAPVLFFIVVVDGFFAVLEDHNRHVDDERANNTKIDVWNPELGEFEEKA